MCINYQKIEEENKLLLSYYKLLYQLHRLSKVENWTLNYNLLIFCIKTCIILYIINFDVVLNDLDLKSQKLSLISNHINKNDFDFKIICYK